MLPSCPHMTKDLQQHVLCTTLPKGVSREDAIRTLAAALSDTEAERIIASALAREEEESTYLGHGLAVPHARLEGLAAPLVCLATCKGSIDWQGEQASLIALLVVPAERPELHLAMLGTLARNLSAARKQGTPLSLPALAETLERISA